MPKKFRVLCVDDQEDFLSTITFWLKSKNFDVLTALDGMTALRILMETPVDAVLVDYKMPGMDGVEVIKQLRVINPEIPIIMVTVHLDEQLPKKLTGLDVKGFVSKLGDLEDLDRLLKDLSKNV